MREVGKVEQQANAEIHRECGRIQHVRQADVEIDPRERMASQSAFLSPMV